jgi:chemosensory pili system protein ChpA (sensor histidine kinase/response regulator)
MIDGGWILVVDDDESVQEIVSLVLSQRGWTVRVAGDGLIALEQLRSSTPPKVILLDIRMPRLNGLELMRALKADAALSSIPVVVLSGDSAAAEASMALGARVYLRKPFDLEELISSVENLI